MNGISIKINWLLSRFLTWLSGCEIYIPISIQQTESNREAIRAGRIGQRITARWNALFNPSRWLQSQAEADKRLYKRLYGNLKTNPGDPAEDRKAGRVRYTSESLYLRENDRIGAEEFIQATK
jgi:hypothetical protein